MVGTVTDMTRGWTEKIITKVSKEINLLQFYCYQFVSVVFLECSLLFTNSSSSELQVSDPSLACCILL